MLRVLGLQKRCGFGEGAEGDDDGVSGREELGEDG